MSSRPSRGAARLASILDALPDALLLVNANGTVVNANAIALETFEAPGTALVGRGLLDLLPSFDPKRIPGSMRSPREAAEDTRTKPTRMVARRTDGSEFPAQVTSSNLEDGRTPYADYGDGVPHYTGDELLMLVVRDLSGTVDTEAELARQQRQTEMILRAAAEGVVGVDTEGKVVLVNPSAAQILGHRATDLGGKELHPLVHHSRPDGSPLAYEETPLADTLRSGRKHRVRGQVLWRKDGKAVPVDLTTAPVRDGEQLVGAVMTFTDRSQYDALAARTNQLRALLDTSLRGPLAELRSELTGLAADPAGQLWPEANQMLHHLSAGYARITTLIDNVLAFQRLDRGEDKLNRTPVSFDEVVDAAVEAAVELIGPGRAQYAVHAPPIEVEVDAPRMVQALAHLVADVAGVDAAGNTIAYSGDSTIVVAAAQRGDVVRIDVRGPSAGGDPVHLPLARGIVERHGGVLQTHEVPGQGSAYVLEVPVGPGAGKGTKGTGTRGKKRAPGGGDADSDADSGSGSGSGSRSGTDTGAGGASATGPGGAGGSDSGTAGGRPPRPRQSADDTGTVVAPWAIPAAADQSEAPTGRRRALRHPGSGVDSGPGQGPDEANASDGGQGRNRGGNQGAGPGTNGTPSDGTPVDPAQHQAQHQVQQPSRRRARRGRPEEQPQAPAQGAHAQGRPGRDHGQGQSSDQDQGPDQGQGPGPGVENRRELPAAPIPNALPSGGTGEQFGHHHTTSGQLGPVGPAGLQPGPMGTPGGQHGAHGAQFGLDNQPGRPGGGQSGPGGEGTGRRGRRALEAGAPEGGPVAVPPQGHAPQAEGPPQQRPEPQQQPQAQPQPQGRPEQTWPAPGGSATPEQEQGRPALPPQPAWPQAAQGPASARPQDPRSQDPRSQDPRAQDPSHQSHGRAISVRTLGQGVPFAVDPHSPQPQTPTQAVQAQNPEGLPAQVAAGGSGRRRRLAPQQGQGQPSHILPQVPSQPPAPGSAPGTGESHARQHPQADPDSGQLPARGPAPQHRGRPQRQQIPGQSGPKTAPLPPVVPPEPAMPPHAPGRSYAIGAPAAGAAEGPEPLDGPNGAVDVTDVNEAADDRQDEPFEEPRRLLVWPEPDVSTRQALTDRGYRPVTVRSREEVDAQVAEPPAALFVDPLTGPITRTALQSLRQAAAAADVPVLVTAGLGQATREAAYGADPAVLLKALAPRDSEQHPPRVLLVENHEPIAQAFAATLERRGMQVTPAASETDAMTKAAQVHPNLVVMDLMLIRRRRQGIVDWLRTNSRLNSTPLVVYTSAGIDPAELPRLASGETVLFLAERSTSSDVQARIVDLLGKIGT